MFSAALQLKGHRAPVVSLFALAELHWLISASEDNTCRIWDTLTNRSVKCLMLPASFTSIQCAILTSDGSTAILASGSSILSFDLQRPDVILREANVLLSTSCEINELAISPCGQYLSTADDDGTLSIYAYPAMSLLQSCPQLHSNIITSLSWLPSPPSSASSSSSSLPSSPASLVTAGCDCNLSFTKCTSDGFKQPSGPINSLEVLNASMGGVGAPSINPPFVQSVRSSPAPASWLTKSKSQSTLVIAAGCGDGSILVLHSPVSSSLSASIQASHVLQSHTHAVSSLSFIPNSSLLLSGGNDGKLAIWDINDMPIPSFEQKKKPKPKDKKKGAASAQSVHSVSLVTKPIFIASHGSPINALESIASKVFVADLTNNITMYEMKP